MHSASRALGPFEVYGSIRTDRAKAEALETWRNDILGAGNDSCLQSKRKRERELVHRGLYLSSWGLYLVVGKTTSGPTTCQTSKKHLDTRNCSTT